MARLPLLCYKFQRSLRLGHASILAHAPARTGSRVGRAEIKGTSVELDALVQDVIRELEMAIHGRSIHWELAALPRVIGDASLLKQVLTNLIDNAIKYPTISCMRTPRSS